MGAGRGVSFFLTTGLGVDLTTGREVDVGATDGMGLAATGVEAAMVGLPLVMDL